MALHHVSVILDSNKITLKFYNKIYFLLCILDLESIESLY